MLGPAALLGTVKDCAQSAAACFVCRTLIEELASQSAHNKLRQPADDDMVEMVYITFMGVWEIAVMPPENSFRWPGPSSIASLNLIRYVEPRDAARPTLHKREMSAYLTDRSRTDFSRIKKWKSYCDVNHHGTCFAIGDPWKRMDLADNLFLIDAEAECVLRQPALSAYLTLSYVWGAESTPLVSTTANIGALSKPHSLAGSSTLGRRLPRVIRDAMMVTLELGYRYLWVDRLCIVQDDEPHKQQQLAAMAAIYANSSITIIAAQGGDAQGLPGASLMESLERRPFSTISLPSGVTLLLDKPKLLGEPYESPKDSDYRRRGWTLQEEMLSNRTLKFGHQEVRWMCRKMRCREIYDDDLQVQDNRRSSNELQLFKPYPDIRTYGHLAVDYTSRILSYDSDAVHAFSAVIAAFSRSMRGGMLYGLPELLFEGALLWQPRTPLRRRHSPSAAPSWSFLGWQGPGLNLGIWQELYLNTARDLQGQYLYFRSVVRLTSCVDYYKTDILTGNRSLVLSSYDNETKRRLTTRESSPGGNPSPVRPTWTDDSHKVPLPREPFAPITGSWAPTLTVRTQMCSILAGDVLPSDRDPREESCKDISLLDNNGSVIGAVTLNSNHHGDVSGTKLCLVILSRGIISWRAHSWAMPELGVFHAGCPQPCPASPSCQAEERFVPYDFYNVMWVGWEANMAYRKGIGRVLVSYWDGLRPEETEIVLV
ncbi:hypothetical protein MFIFM68171_08022 [Madurella fahalii]|uniref:Heterokaryon incompatibility domain-containing protein n=1 Tax=Madurella fahalii TaxID=1157608 RepID=A0ABQ0GJ73_9PEZI